MLKKLNIFLGAYFVYVFFLSIPSYLTAHPMAPSLLEVIEVSPGQSNVLWKTPLARVPGVDLEPLLPKTCQRVGKIESKSQGTARVDRWQISCELPLPGQTIEVEGLSNFQSNVILHLLMRDGRSYQVVLNSQNPRYVVPEHPQASIVFKNYLTLGIKHILTGWDHLLFVLGLVLLVKGRKALLWTITAFTVGHSVTLSLAALGFVHVWSAVIEALIAFSILVLAIELTRTQKGKGTFFHRFPWLMAFGFGLLHGLGFAGALAELGLPVGEIPMALFSFNVGIEVGQLAFIVLVLLIQKLWLHIPIPLRFKRMELTVYVIGSLAAYWFFERLSKLSL